jgi:hypothetical protein
VPGQARDRIGGQGDIEGGEDNDEVYTFALVHYLAAGVVVRF